jgi:hypothetical protein
MKNFIKFLYLVVFVFFAISSKPFRFIGVYSQERFLLVAKEVADKLLSDRAVKLTCRINRKVKELKSYLNLNGPVAVTQDESLMLTNEVNYLVSELVAENTKSYLYRCFVYFT